MYTPLLKIPRCHIVKLHLAQPNVDIDKHDDWGDTPEAVASKMGHTSIVTPLQESINSA